MGHLGPGGWRWRMAGWRSASSTWHRIFAVVLNVRLDERSFENVHQRMAAILTRYGKAIFDTPHPVAQRADLAAMIGTSRVGMYRALREMEADGLVKRERSGSIRILDEDRLSTHSHGGAPGRRPAL